MLRKSPPDLGATLGLHPDFTGPDFDRSAGTIDHSQRPASQSNDIIITDWCWYVLQRAWPAALNARDTDREPRETTPVVYIRVLIHDTHDDTHDPSVHIHDNATAAGYLA